MARPIPPQLVFRSGNQVEKYRLVILRVTLTDSDKPKVAGMEVPFEMRFLDDNDVAEISENDRFITAYVPESVFGPRPQGGK